MNNKSKIKSKITIKSKKTAKQTAPPTESRAAESVTVAWMLAMSATAIGEFGTLCSWLIVVLFFQTDKPFLPLASLPGLLLFIAFVTGMVCLALEPLARRLRKSPVPFGVTMTARVIGVSPILTFIFFSVLAAG